MAKIKPIAGILVHLLFWSWNAIFLAFALFGFAPLVGFQLFEAVRVGLVPWEFLAYGLALTGVPVFAVAVGALFLRRSPARLFAMGYGIEAPLLIAMIGRLFGIREMMAGVSFLLTLATIGIATLLWQLLIPLNKLNPVETRKPVANTWLGALVVLRVIGLTILTLVGLYTSLWAAFYALPVIASVIRMAIEFIRELPNIFRYGYGPSLQAIPFMLLGTGLMVYSGSLFVALPIVAPLVYGFHWWRSVATLRRHFHWPRPLTIVLPISVVALCLTLFVVTNQQPQKQVFTLLEKPPTSAQEAAGLLQQQETLRAGLLNAYLATYRYTSAVGEVTHIKELYRTTLDTNDQQAGMIQSWYEAVTRPFLYDPVSTAEINPLTSPFNALMGKDAARASELYQHVFDQPINKAELDTIVQAVRSTWSRDTAIAAWQAVDDREILLTRQEITVTEHGDWADVELHEAYQNQTAQRQEVVYYFSLPESAAITGLWLGASDDRSQRFAYQVAPRGAAQSTYRNEVRQNIDPALVEQIGPAQYRLRVFPIEPPRWGWDATQSRSMVSEAAQMHLWLTWRVLAQNKAWALPRMNEKRNVYWDRTTTRLVNGQPVPGDMENWLPATVPATTPGLSASHSVTFDDGAAGGMQTTITAEPAGSRSMAAAVEAFTRLRLAIVLDRSRSMAAHADEVSAAHARLRDLKLATPADVYLTASDYSGMKPALVALADLNADQLVYLGGQNPGDLLRQFNALREGRQYDAILVLTDNSGYEMGADPQKIAAPGAPVWMVHLGGALPLGYNDNTLEAIQSSGGGVASTLDQAIERIGTAALQSHQADIVDGYVWRFTSHAASTSTPSQAQDDPFGALASRRLVLAQMQQHRDELGKVEVLDQLHKIAVGSGIVTPYSSMIVLVDAAQKQRLADAEKRGDRFTREYEQIGETTPEGLQNVTAVPEPEEWLLIFLAIGGLVWLVWRRRHAPALRT